MREERQNINENTEHRTRDGDGKRKSHRHRNGKLLKKEKKVLQYQLTKIRLWLN